MAKYRIRQVVYYRVPDRGVIIYEYLGRGLNALLRLDHGDKFVELSEDHMVLPFGGDDIGGKNQYRRMIGKYIYSYGFPDQDYFEYELETYSTEYMASYIEGWIMASNMSQENLVKLFNPNNGEISELLDECIPLDKEDEYDDDDQFFNSIIT